jgi:hypothetical protein
LEICDAKDSTYDTWMQLNIELQQMKNVTSLISKNKEEENQSHNKGKGRVSPVTFPLRACYRQELSVSDSKD